MGALISKSTFLRGLTRALFKKLMMRVVGGHRRAGHPALAGYAFDHITLIMHLDGRFADREIAGLEKRIFPCLPQGGVCLDIGANIGNHAVHFADSFAQIHAFEPNNKALALLRINAQLKPNITVHGVGLSDCTQDLSAQQPLHNLGGTGACSAHAVGTVEEVTLPLRRLDDLELDLGGHPITFVKIDVEGHEAQVIRGAAETLIRHRPVLGMEVDRRSVENGSSPALDAAHELGYTHLYASSRSNRTRFRKVDRAAARNHPLLILSMDPLDIT